MNTPPDDGRPTIGWAPMAWKGGKRDCAKCHKGVRRGIVHVNEKRRAIAGGIPPNSVLCHLCYTKIMSPDGREAPAGTAGF